MTSFEDAAAFARQPTPGPYSIEHSNHSARRTIVGQDNTLVAQVYAFDRTTEIHNISRVDANARFIAKACNHHHQLVAALDKLQNAALGLDAAMDGVSDQFHDEVAALQGAVAQARQALAAARDPAMTPPDRAAEAAQRSLPRERGRGEGLL